jgi:hypothetical protein
MDELQTLKEFRTSIAFVAPDDPVRERTMAAIRARIEREALASKKREKPRHARPRSLPRLHFSRRRVPVLALACAAVVAVLAVLPARQSNPSLVGEALAAMGSGNVLHVVTEQPTGRELIDLSSGQPTPILQQEEIWFDEGRGLRRDIITIGGRIADDTFQSPAGGFTPHGVIYDCAWIAAHPTQATKARVSCNASGDNGTIPRTVPRPKPTLDPGLLGFVDGYRHALASGAAREDGSGTIDGEAVDWLVFQTADGSERVALDAATHKPVLLRGPRLSLQMRITTIETADDAVGKFVKPSPSETSVLPNMGRAEDQRTLDLSASAIRSGYPGAVWAGLDLSGLPLASATVQSLTTHYPDGQPTAAGTGLQLQYGSLTANGHRDFSKPYVTVSVAPGAELASAYMWGFEGAVPPPPGQLLTEVPHGGPNALYLGFMTVNGKLVSIQASSEELLLAGARSLTEAR